MVQFAKLNADGSTTNVREIGQINIAKCPHFILVADHYRDDGSCKCNDPDAKEMKKWGYRWSAKDRLWK